jgi:hypothetical protein
LSPGIFTPRNGRPLILYFHGNGGALIDRVPRFRHFLERGYGLLAVSYRGYGGSTGSPTQVGLIRDGEAAYRKSERLAMTVSASFSWERPSGPALQSRSPLPIGRRDRLGSALVVGGGRRLRALPNFSGRLVDA